MYIPALRIILCFTLLEVFAVGQNNELVAVSLSRTVPETSFKDPLTLQDDRVDFGDAWNRFTNELTITNTSVYFFHLNAGANPGKKVNLNLRGGQKNVDIYRGMTSNDGTDTIGRNFISQVEAGSTLRLLNEATFELYSDVGRQTSLTAYDLQNFLSPTQQKIFSVARRSQFTTLGKVVFTETLVNIGGDFDDQVSYTDFVVKRTGLHFITFSAGLRPGMSARIQIKSKDLGRLTEIYHPTNNHDGPNMISKSLMYELYSGDAIYIELLSGELYGDGERQISFGGFFYDPINSLPYAWSLYSDASYDASVAKVDPLPFQGVLVNTYDMFNASTNQIAISQSGLYYIELNMHAQKQKPSDIKLVVAPEQLKFQIDRTTSNHNNIASFGSGMLVELFKGNEVKVILGQGTYSYGDGDRVSTMTGHLVAAYPEA